MLTRITLAGCTGWTGRALVAALASSQDLRLVAAVSRSAAGRDAGEAAGTAPLGVRISATLPEALKVPSDVLIDYTKPNVVKHHVLLALAQGRHVVIGTSGLTAHDYDTIDVAAKEKQRGVLAAGNFSITATLMRRFALEAARYIPDVEVIDYASAKKTDSPSGTARELAEMLASVRGAATSVPLETMHGPKEARGAAIGAPTPVQVHSLRLPSYVIACEAILGALDERLTIRHDAGSSATPYVVGTLLAARRVGSFTGLRRGLDSIME